MPGRGAEVGAESTEEHAEDVVDTTVGADVDVGVGVDVDAGEHGDDVVGVPSSAVGYRAHEGASGSTGDDSFLRGEERTSRKRGTEIDILFASQLSIPERTR